MLSSPCDDDDEPKMTVWGETDGEMYGVLFRLCKCDDFMAPPPPQAALISAKFGDDEDESGSGFSTMLWNAIRSSDSFSVNGRGGRTC